MDNKYKYTYERTQNYDNEKTLNKLVKLFADINALRLFRKENGRSQRTFIVQTI